MATLNKGDNDVIIIIIIKAKQAIANFVCHAMNNNQQIVFNTRYLSCVE